MFSNFSWFIIAFFKAFNKFVAHTNAIAQPKAPLLLFPTILHASPIPRTNDRKYANTEMKKTSLITVSINDVTPLPIPWNIELATIPNGTIIRKRHITCKNAAIDGAINEL